MTTLRSRRRGRSRGQALVEFALVAPIFFFLLFSIIEFGRAVYYIQMLNNAAREGARYAIVHGGSSLDCASGPMRVTIPPTVNTCDLPGDNIVATVKTFAIGIIDASPTDFKVEPRWCATVACPDTNEIGKGDGTNERNQTVKVEVEYTFRPMIAGVVPLPTFTLTGGSTLVVNY